MLASKDRLSVYDIVRAPVGWAVDAVLALTYSVSLETVLSLPAAIVADMAGPAAAGAHLAPMQLAALRRICDHTLIFCQTGATHGAELVSPAVVELEGMVQGVSVGDASFHPKLWLVRFSNGEGDDRRTVLRMAISSRNLTADTSWDAGVVLDGRHRSGTARSNAIVDLFRTLPSLCTRPLAARQLALLTSMADSLGATTWLLPQGVSDLQFRVLGSPPGQGWLPPPNDRMAVISPFLHKSTLDVLAVRSKEPLALVSRRLAFDQVWAATSSFARKAVFAPADASDLHAKVYVWDTGSRTRAAVGSMNATRPATGGANVEVMVDFDCTKLLDGHGCAAFVEGMGEYIEDYAPPDDVTEPEEEPDDRPARRALSACRPFLRCEAVDSLWSVSLESELPLDAVAGMDLPGLSFRPVTLPEGAAAPCHDALLEGRSATLGTPLELFHVTGFVAFRTVGASTYFTLNLEVRGVSLEERRDAVLRKLLPTRDSLYGMLRIMLGDVSGLEGAGRRGDGSEGNGEALPSTTTGLLELLVRCAADYPARLDGIAKMVEALDVLKNDDLAEFRRIWTGVRLAAKTSR